MEAVSREAIKTLIRQPNLQVVHLPSLNKFYSANINFNIWKTPGYMNNCAIYAILCNLLLQNIYILNEYTRVDENIPPNQLLNKYLDIMSRIFRKHLNNGINYIGDDDFQQLTKLYPIKIIILEYDNNSSFVSVIERFDNKDDSNIIPVYLAFNKNNGNHWEHLSSDLQLDDFLLLTS